MPAVRGKPALRGPGQRLASGIRADPTTVQCTCIGCDLSFSSKKAFDGHRSSKFVPRACKKRFVRGQRLSLVVTSRDFRVSGRNSDATGRVNRDITGEDTGKLHLIYTNLHPIYIENTSSIHYIYILFTKRLHTFYIQFTCILHFIYMFFTFVLQTNYILLTYSLHIIYIHDT